LEEIGPGVYHWKAVHPKIKIEVSSYYVADSGTLIDPMVPAEGVEWFRAGPSPERIVLTNRHHYRQSQEVAAEFGCPVLCHEAGLHEFDRGPTVEGFRFGERLAPRITALEVGAICPEETALLIELGDGMLSFADGLIRHEELGFVSDRLLGDDPEAVKNGLCDSLRRLLDNDFDALLFAHGDPLMSGGREALRQFVERDSEPGAE
jgi:glyoxylase-like metal-dependent hydrolase (beta-lactamase superfamily II)